MFRFIKQVSIQLLSFGGSLISKRIKCISTSKELRITRPTLFALNPEEIRYYPFMVSLDRCNQRCIIFLMICWVEYLFQI